MPVSVLVLVVVVVLDQLAAPTIRYRTVYELAPLTVVQVMVAPVAVMPLTATFVGVPQLAKVIKLVDALYVLLLVPQMVATCIS